MKTIINCSVCGIPLSGRQTLFCSSRCKNHVHQSYEAQKERALERKLYFIKSLGGGCSRCGYHDNLAALSFHHRGGKEYELDARSLSNRGLADMAKEIAKCELLCANCHMELHHPHLDVAKMSIEPTALTTELQAHKSRDRNTTHDASMIIAEKGLFEKKFAQNLVDCGVKPGQTIVLGVSGGVDSMTMLNLFTQSQMELNIIVAHMNHGLRPEAVNDEKLVKDLAKNHGLKYFGKSLKTQDRHSHILENVRMSRNTEEYFRDERRAFLLSVAREEKGDFVALAHNANDQAETLILNLVRGSGPAGLGAMSMSEGRIIRPLLNISRAEIEKYALTQGLIWHEDVTNRDTNYNRNYIRHRLIPLLERINPEYLNAINRTTSLQREIDQHFKEEAYRLVREPSAERLRRLDKPLLYEVLGLLYEEVKGNRKDLSLKHLAAVESLIASERGSKTLDLPGEITVRRRYDKLDFYVKKEHNTPSAPSTKKLKLGAQKFGNWEVTASPLTVTPAKAGVQKNAADRLDSSLRWNDEIVIDTEMLINLAIRTRKPGDKIAQKGLGGNKKLQDLFVDAKIDRAKRDTYPIIVDSKSGKVLWVPGLAKSEYKRNNVDLYQITIEEADHETKKD